MIEPGWISMPAPGVDQSGVSLTPRSEWSANDMDDGLLRTPHGFLSLAVAPQHVERAGRLLDRAIRAVEDALGGRVLVEPKMSIIEVGQDRFRFRLKQENTRSEHRPSPAERREMERLQHVHSVPKWDWRPTDRFRFEIYDPDDFYRPRAQLTDGKRASLEQKLEGLPDLVRELVQANRVREAERERIRREWEEQSRLKREAEERADRRRRAIESLLSEADRWRRANGLREYLVALETRDRSSFAQRSCGFRGVGPSPARA